MRSALAALLLSTALLPLAAQAPGTPSPLAEQRQRIQRADYRVTGRIIRVQANGIHTSYPVTIKAHWFPGVLRVLLEIGAASSAGGNATSESRLPVHILFEMRPGGGRNTILVVHPGDKEAVALPSELWSGGPLGNDFSYEDFLEAQYFWTGQTALGSAKLGARDCILWQSTPAASDKSRYAEVKSWIDRSSGFPVYLEKTLKDGALKEYTYFGLRQESGLWSAHQIEAKRRGGSGSTLLIVDRGTPKAKLGEADFSPVLLLKF